MNIDFKDFNLEVVTVKRSSFDYSMPINKNCVSLNKEIVQELDYSAQVLITFNKETKVMGIQVRRAKSRVMNNNLKETLFNIMPE